MISKKRKGGPFILPLMAIVFTLVGCGAILLFLGYDTELTLRRNSLCEIVKTDLAGKSELVDSFEFASFHQAVLQESRNEKSTTYRVALETDNGTIPLVDYYSSGKKSHLNRIDSINGFLRTTDAELKVKQSGTAIRLVGFIFAGIGVFLAITFVWKLIRVILLLIVAIASKN